MHQLAECFRDYHHDCRKSSKESFRIRRKIHVPHIHRLIKSPTNGRIILLQDSDQSLTKLKKKVVIRDSHISIEDAECPTHLLSSICATELNSFIALINTHLFFLFFCNNHMNSMFFLHIMKYPQCPFHTVYHRCFSVRRQQMYKIIIHSICL